MDLRGGFDFCRHGENEPINAPHGHANFSVLPMPPKHQRRRRSGVLSTSMGMLDFDGGPQESKRDLP